MVDRQRDLDPGLVVADAEAFGEFDESCGDPCQAVCGCELNPAGVGHVEPNEREVKQRERGLGMAGEESPQRGDRDQVPGDEFDRADAAIAAADSPAQPPAIAGVNTSIADQAPLSAQSAQSSTLIVSSLAPTLGTAPTVTAQSWSLVVNSANQTESATAPSTSGAGS